MGRAWDLGCCNVLGFPIGCGVAVYVSHEGGASGTTLPTCTKTRALVAAPGLVVWSMGGELLWFDGTDAVESGSMGDIQINRESCFIAGRLEFADQFPVHEVGRDFEQVDHGFGAKQGEG